MFEIKPHKSLVNDLPIIVDNYQILAQDENPILYIGVNRYKNLVLGIIIEDDDEARKLSYFHVILDTETYYNFLSKKITLLDIMKGNNPLFIIEKNYNGNLISSNILGISEIPEDYLPLQNSYCPDIAIPFSLNYGIRLQGKKSDLHKGEVHEINNIQNSFSDVLKSAMNSLQDFNLDYNCYLEPALVGSYKINFNIEFDSQQLPLFSVDESLIASYITKYLDFIMIKLPTENNNVFTESTITSKAFKEVEHDFEKLYAENIAAKPGIVLEQKLLDSINNTALKFEDITNQIKTSKSFDTIEVISYDSSKTEIGIGLIDKTYYEKIQNKLIIPENETETDIIEEDKEEKSYRVLIYQLNVESGKGGAMLYYGQDEKFDRIAIHITKNGKELNNTIFTNSLHEGKVVTIKGKARNVNGHYKLLKVDL